MKITRIECIPITVPYKMKKPFAMGGFTRAASNSVLVKIHTDEGITGIAEHGNASTWYIGETQDSVLGVISTVFGPQILLGEDPFNIESIGARMDKAARYSNQAKAVIDFALHDIMGKKLGVPVYQLLGGRCIDRVPLGYVISFGPPDEIAAQAVEIFKAGFKSLKLKVGQSTAEEDIALVKAVREAVGDEARLGIDTNGAWNYYQALEILKKLEKYDLFMTEQPLPWWDIDGMARLRKKIGIPVFTDESLVDLKSVMEIIHKDAADGLFIKIAKIGGFLKAKKIISVAKAAGLPVMCGCFIGTGIEAATQGQILVADEWMTKLEQENLGPITIHDVLDTAKNPIKDDLAKNVPRYENGYFYPAEGPGLGVELNEEVLKKVMTPGKSPVVIGK